MGQSELIKEIAKFGLKNDQQSLLSALTNLIEYSKQHRKVNFAIQLQSLLRDSLRTNETEGLSVVGSLKHKIQQEEKDLGEFILEKLTSDYTLNDLVCTPPAQKKLELFIDEHLKIETLRKFNLPISNKLLLHGPSGCGKTLAAYSLAGELRKIMYVVDLGSIVSSRLGETSKNLSKIFKKASSENCILFLDEFDSLGKVRDYSQDHGEMKRVVNTLLQLFDYLPQETIVVAATNQKHILDDALLRRFDLAVDLELPSLELIRTLVSKTIDNTGFQFPNKKQLDKCIKQSLGLSYYSIQRTLINAIKQDVLSKKSISSTTNKIDSEAWFNLINEEKLKVAKA